MNWEIIWSVVIGVSIFKFGALFISALLKTIAQYMMQNEEFKKREKKTFKERLKEEQIKNK
jgi:predicted membrane protein